MMFDEGKPGKMRNIVKGNNGRTRKMVDKGGQRNRTSKRKNKSGIIREKGMKRSRRG